MHPDVTCVAAQNLPPIPPPSYPAPGPDPQGILRIVFVSRISPMKNLDTAIAQVQRCLRPVRFEIHGACVEPDYLRRCQAQAAESPPHISIAFHGELHPDRVIETLARHDLFFLPTLGENFGHVILESLLAGTPVLLSDRTPWNRVEAAGAGWTLGLDRPERFSERIDAFAAVDPGERLTTRSRARVLAEDVCRDPRALDGYLELYRRP